MSAAIHTNRARESQEVQLARMIKQQKRYAYDPELWARDMIGFEADVWQAEALKNFIKYHFLAISTATGTGKTALAAIILLFFLANRPFAKVACTAPSQGQLFGGLWPEISTWQKKSPFLLQAFKWTKTAVTNKKHPENWFAIARTARLLAKKDTTESLQGLHAKYILMIVDEASGVPNQVMNAVDGAVTTPGAHVLLISNPTRRSGYFYNIISDKRKQVEHGGMFKTMHVSAEDAKYCDVVHIKHALEVYGRDSDFYRVKVLGLPPRSEEAALLTPEQIFDAHLRHLQTDDELLKEKHGIKQLTNQVIVSCDPARYGGDATVYFVRIGQRIKKRISVKMMDTNKVAEILFDMALEENANHICVDSIGIGSGVVDNVHRMVKEHNFQAKHDPIITKFKPEVHEIVVGESPVRKYLVKVGEDQKLKEIDKFLNLRAELFWSLRAHINMISIEVPHGTDILDDELQKFHYGWDQRDKKIKLESKDELKKSLGRSPNDADAFALLFYPDLLAAIKKLVYSSESFKIGKAQMVSKKVELSMENTRHNADADVSFSKRINSLGPRIGIRPGSIFSLSGRGKRIGAGRYSGI